MIVLWIIYGLIVLSELILILVFQFSFKEPLKITTATPHVSILVAARNEEEHLGRCLNALTASDYELDQVEILVGNDHSTDKTEQIIQAFTQAFSFIKGVTIQDQKDGLIAKGNVLAQLVDQAKYDKILIIDADMVVSKGWLSQMSVLLDQYDLISGYTTVSATQKKGMVEYFDWAVVLHTMKAMADSFKPISILGNNMGFRRMAYDQVGGFKGLGPTDVEDLGLLRRFQKAGKHTFQYVGKGGSAETLPQVTFEQVLIQRCRWMNGLFKHNWLVSIPALFARMWMSIGAIFTLIDLQTGLMILAYGIMINCVKFFQISTRLGALKKFNGLSPFIISVLDTFALLRLIFVGKVSWKGRKFK